MKKGGGERRSGRKLDYGAQAGEERRCGGGVREAERVSKREREKGAEGGCEPTP